MRGKAYARPVLAASGQVILLAAALLAYRLSRHWVDGRGGEAMAHAASLWDLERTFHLPDEAEIQAWALRWDAWVPWANRYYVFVHFPATGAFLAWVWLRHRPAWSRVRAAIILSMALALAVHAFYPLAPPRLLPQLGMVDLMNVYGPSAYAEQPGEGGNNQFAAMPSLHVGWAVLVAWGVIRYARASGWRWLAAAHPVLTALVVVLTANHYWLDGVAGTAVVAVCLAASGGLERRAAGTAEAGHGRWPRMAGWTAGMKGLERRRGKIASTHGQGGAGAGREPVRRAAR